MSSRLLDGIANTSWLSRDESLGVEIVGTLSVFSGVAGEVVLETAPGGGVLTEVGIGGTG